MSTRSNILQLTAFALVVLGTKLLLLEYAANSVPIWDQWDAEAANLIIPWMEGTLTWDGMIYPHNEHRILLTRLLALGLFELNGQWDPMVEMVVNAVISTGAGILLLVMLLRHFPSAGIRPWLFVIVLVAWMVPYGWQNTLAGFQSQFYLMQICALLTINGMLCSRTFSTAWIVGFIAALLAIFSMSSGLLAAAVVFGMCLVLAIWGRILGESFRPWAITGFAAAVAMAAGLSLLVVVPHHDFLKAKSVIEFLGSFSKAAGWPWTGFVHPAFILQLPVVLLAILPFVEKRQPRTAELFVMGLGAWVLMQALGFGYARGGSGEDPSSRYMDLFLLGPIANFCALVLIARTDVARNFLRPLTWFAGLWLFTLIAGSVDLLTNLTVPDINKKRGFAATQKENVSKYLETGDETYVTNKPFRAIPYPWSDRLILILSNEGLRQVLPADIAPSRQIELGQPGSTFVSPGQYVHFSAPIGSGFGSFGANGDATRGTFVSRELTVDTSFVRMDLIGNTADETMYLKLVAEGVEPVKVALHGYTDQWTTVQVPVPARTFHIEAGDDSEKYWLAFANLKPLGWLSYYTGRIISKADIFIYLAITLWFLTLVMPQLGRLLDSGANRK